MQPHVLFICLTVYVVDCVPQWYNQYPYMKGQSRSINTGEPNNQRYHYNSDPSYDNAMRNPYFYNNYYRPRAPFGSGQRPRGPASGMIPAESVRFYERNDYDDGVMVNPRIDLDTAEHKPHSTRILNSAKKAPAPSDDIMLADQPTDFVFPGAVGTHVAARPSTTQQPPVHFRPNKAKIAAHCKNTFCETVDDYPTDYINQVLKYNSSRYKDILGQDDLEADISITGRIGSVDGSPMCLSREELVRPKVAKNKENDWMFIVNSDSGENAQAIRVETCIKEGGSCEMSSSFPVNYVTECKQKYILRKMLALDPDGNPVPDNFRIPSCCSCYFKNDIHFQSKRDTSPAKRYTRK